MVGPTPACVKTCNSQDTMSATWRKERSTVETNEIMKTVAHRSESWCWRQLLSLLSPVLMLVLTQLVCGRPKSFCRTRSAGFITAFTVNYQWPLFWVNWIDPTTAHLFSLQSILIASIIPQSTRKWSPSAFWGKYECFACISHFSHFLDLLTPITMRLN
jgi:hypothetical protein